MTVLVLMCYDPVGLDDDAEQTAAPLANTEAELMELVLCPVESHTTDVRSLARCLRGGSDRTQQYCAGDENDAHDLKHCNSLDCLPGSSCRLRPRPGSKPPL